MYTLKNILRITGRVVLHLLVFLGTLLSTAIFWMLDTWKNLTIDEMLFHLQAPKEGTDSAIITGFILRSLLPAVIVVVVCIFVTVLWKKKKALYGYLMLGAALLAAGFSVSHVWAKLDIGNYIRNGSQYSTLIDDNYVYPSEVAITFPEEKRNLIYIYMESMESTYADRENGGAFEENLIPNLTKIAKENESFNGGNGKLNGAYALNKGSYTMGALFAHNMALPLIVPFAGNTMEAQGSFMPTLEGMGDVLEKEGYQSTFLIGSEAVFGGRKLFFTDHGSYEMMDYDVAKAKGDIPEDYYVFWGYEDWRLFEIGKRTLLEKAETGQPFNLTMLTVDTHFEDGYLCEKCENLHPDNPYADVYNCSDRLVSEFIAWIQQQEFYENTTIVLVGDHLTMDSDFCRQVESSYDRKVYATIINGAVEPVEDKERAYSTLDMFPTTLAALGAEIEGNRLGLGTNLYSSEPTLVEKYGVEEINTAFDRKSVMMEYLNQDTNVEASIEYYNGTWFYDGYQFALEKDIFMKDGLFLAEDKVTRGEMVQALYQLEGSPEAPKRAARRMFKDVRGAEYEQALNWACANGIMTDEEKDRRFGGPDSLTREEFMWMLYRYAQYKGLDVSERGTFDGLMNVDQLSDYAAEAMEWGMGAGLIAGINQNDLAPKGLVIKSQAATFIMRFFEKYGL